MPNGPSTSASTSGTRSAMRRPGAGGEPRNPGRSGAIRRMPSASAAGAAARASPREPGPSSTSTVGPDSAPYVAWESMRHIVTLASRYCSPHELEHPLAPGLVDRIAGEPARQPGAREQVDRHERVDVGSDVAARLPALHHGAQDRPPGPQDP